MSDRVFLAMALAGSTWLALGLGGWTWVAPPIFALGLALEIRRSR
jgi:hypothetical protein